jgi:tetratricopeptide (TPR) repeat protein
MSKANFSFGCQRPSREGKWLGKIPYFWVLVVGAMCLWWAVFPAICSAQNDKPAEKASAQPPAGGNSTPPRYTPEQQARIEENSKLVAQAVKLNSQGKYAEAVEAGKQALAKCEEIVGPDDPETARCLNNLGLMYDDHGKYADGLPLIKRALAIREKH